MPELTTRRINSINRQLQIIANAERAARQWDDYPISRTRGAFMRACYELRALRRLESLLIGFHNAIAPDDKQIA